MSDEPGFEEAMQRLEEIVRLLEGGALSLAEGMELYREGTRQARYCQQKLAQAKLELEVLQNGEAVEAAEPDGDAS